MKTKKFVHDRIIYRDKTEHIKYIEVSFNKTLCKVNFTHWTQWSITSAQGHGYCVDLRELAALKDACDYAIQSFRKKLNDRTLPGHD